jgi:hypothetical protein
MDGGSGIGFWRSGLLSETDDLFIWQSEDVVFGMMGEGLNG